LTHARASQRLLENRLHGTVENRGTATDPHGLAQEEAEATAAGSQEEKQVQVVITKRNAQGRKPAKGDKVAPIQTSIA